MVHVGGISPSLGGGLPKSPSFHQGLALATVLPQDSNKAYPVTFALQYQPLQPLLIGKSLIHTILLAVFQFFLQHFLNQYMYYVQQYIYSMKMYQVYQFER